MFLQAAFQHQYWTKTVELMYTAANIAFEKLLTFLGKDVILQCSRNFEKCRYKLNKIKGKFPQYLRGPDEKLSRDIVCTSLSKNVAQFAINMKG